MMPAWSHPRFWRWLAVASLVMNGVLVTSLGLMRRDAVSADEDKAPPVVAGPDAAAPSSAWASFGDEKLLELGLRLRRSGFPASVVREVLLARIAERPVNERLAKRIALENENPQLADELLRVQPDETDQRLADTLFRRRYGDLSDEKTMQLKRLLRDYSEMLQTLARSTGNLAHSSAGYQLLEKEMTEDTARLLTPEEFFEYELRSSEAARQMRRLLYGFDTTEAEFRALFPLFRELGFRGPTTSTAGLVSVALREQWGKISDPAFQARIEQVLGPARAADFRRATASALNPAGRIRNP